MEYNTVNYLKHPLSAEELKALLQRAALTPTEVLRTKEPAYREFVAGKNLTDEKLIELMAKHPELLQRPIVIREDKGVLARPVGNLARLGIK